MKSRYQQLVEQQIGMPLEQKLLQMVQSGLTVQEMAAELGVPHSTAHLWRERFLETKVTYRVRETTAV